MNNAVASIVTRTFLLMLFGLGSAQAAANVSASSGFIAADGVRTYMDVGGAWNGTTDVASTLGDQFSFTLTNTTAIDGDISDDTAYEISPSVAVSADLLFVGNSSISFNASPDCAAVTAVTATQASAGADIVFAITPAEYDLQPQCVLILNYGLVTTAAANSGTNILNPQWAFDDANGAGGISSNDQITQSIQVQKGDFIVSKNHNPAAAMPGGESGKIGTTERFNIEVGSSGFGGIFAVQVEDILGAGFDGSLVFDDGALPAGVTGSAAGSIYTLDYIPPGVVVNLGASSTISGCADIDNTVNIRDKLFATTNATETSLDSVTLNLENPDITYNIPTINFDYSGGSPVATVNATVINNGPGITDTINLAYNNLPNGTVAVTSGPWVHNAGASRFEYTGGNIPAGTSVDFSFTITGNSCPFDPVVEQVIWQIEYVNGCNDIFTAIPRVTAVTESSEPELAMSKVASSRFMTTGQAGTYTLSLAGINAANFAATAGTDNDVQIIDQLPSSGISNISIAVVPAGIEVLVGASVVAATPYTPGAPIAPGAFVVVNADLADLPINNITIDFVATDSGSTCNSGFPINNTASATVTSCPGFSDSSNAQIIPNEIASGGFSLVEDFVVVNTTDAPFETGLADTDGTRDAGEGEHINYRASYDLTDVRAGAPSTWVGSVFIASLGKDETPALTTETVVTAGANNYNGFVRYQFSDNSGALSAVADIPNANISINTDNKLEVDLGFLGAGNTNNDQLIIYYTTTVADADIASNADTDPAGYVQRGGGEFLERVTLQVAGGTTGCSGVANYTSAINVNIVRGDPEISTNFTSSPGNGFVDVCEIIPVTVNVGAPGPAANPAFDLYTDNTRVQLDIGDSWRFVTAAGADGVAENDIVYSGHLSDATTVASVIGSGAGTQLQIDSDPQNRAYNGSDGASTALVNLQLLPSYSNKNLISRILFDDNQTRFDLSASRDFTKSNTNARPIVRRADLAVTASPDVMFLNDRIVRWTVYVQNTGTGVAYGASVKDVLPDLYSAEINTAVGSGGDTTFNLNDAGTETATAPCYTQTAPGNVCGSVTSANTVVWQLGDIQPGATRKVQITASVDPNTGSCSINQNTPSSGGAGNEIIAQWGCGTSFVSSLKVSPVFAEPDVKMLVSQDSSSAFCALCSDGDLSLQIKNSGSGKLFNVTGVQDLGTAGISYVPGTAMVSINGAAAVAAGDPTESNTLGGAAVAAGTGRFLVWSSAEIPALAELDRLNGPGTNTVLISFKIQSPGESLGNATDAQKTVQASAGYEPACGAINAGTANGTAFVLSVHQPSITIDKVGWNVSASDLEGDAANTVYGGNGDEVIWRVTATNASGSTVTDAQDLVVRDFLSTTNFDISEYCVVGGAQNIANCPAVFTSLGAPGNDKNTASDSVPALASPQNILTPGETQKFYFRGTVQAQCDNPINTAQIEWGCPAEGAAGGLLATPLADTARLVTAPDSAFGQIVVENHNITWPGSGRGVVSFSLRNNGGTARNISIADIVPVGFVRDTTVTPTITHSAAVLDQMDVSGTTTVGFDLYQTGVPFGTGTVQQNILRHGETVTLSFGILLNTAFDTSTDIDVRLETDSSGNGLDPDSLGSSLSNQLTINFENSCGIAQTAVNANANNINPELPDLDIDFTAANLTSVVTGITDNQAYIVRIANNGDGVAFADNAGVAEIQVVLNIGLGWDILTPADFSFSGGTGSCVVDATLADRQPYTCTLTSSIASGSNVDISFTSEVSDTLSNSQPLSIVDATVTGRLTDGAGVYTGDNYSFDSIRFRTVGFSVNKDILSCSENAAGASFPVNSPAGATAQLVQVGEDCTYRMTANWFGGAGETISGVFLQDDLVGNMAFVEAATAGNLTLNSTLNSSNPASVNTAVYGDTGDVYWHYADQLLSATGDAIQVDFTTRARNNPDDTEGTSGSEIRHDLTRRNDVIVQFDAFGQTFNASTDGYPVGGSAANSVRREQIRVRTPNPTINKQIRNVTQDLPAGAGNYANNVTGQAGDLLEYRIQVSNAALAAARTPLFDAVVSDTLDANLTILDFSTDTIDNDGDGLVDAADLAGVGEGLLAAQTVTFNSTHNSTTNGAGRGLLQMDENDVVTIRIRATINNTVNPGLDLTNTASIVGDTLAGDRGAAVDGAGVDDASGDIMGARQYTVQSSPPARVTITSVAGPASGSKVVTNLSLNNDLAAFPIAPTAGSPLSVVVGEEVEYELAFIVPSSTISDLVLRDTLPAGLSCVEAPSIPLPAGFLPAATVAPTTCNGTEVSWDFSAGGTVDYIVSGAEAGRTVRGRFIARVDNEVGNVQGATAPVTNTNARVTYADGLGGTITADLDDAHLRVVEPTLVLGKSVSSAPLTSVDAGDVLTITVSAANTSADSSAYNVQIQDDLVTPERNLIYSANVNNTAAAGCVFGTVDATTTDIPVFNITRIAPSTTCTFTFDVTVEDTAQPSEILDDTLQGAWTSLPSNTTALNTISGAIGTDGAADGMRNGAIPNAASALNNYEAQASAQLLMSGPSIVKTDLNPALISTIGTRKQYSVVINLPEGMTNGVQINDNLAAGVGSFVLENDATFDVSYSLNNIATINGVAALGSTAAIEAAITAFPADESTGNIVWNIGNVITDIENDQSSSAVSPSITITYFARINNDATTNAGDDLENAASLVYLHGETAVATTLNAAAVPAVTVLEPSITGGKVGRNVTKGDPDNLSAPITAPDAGDVLEYYIGISAVNTANSSDVFDMNLVDTLPAGVEYIAGSSNYSTVPGLASSTVGVAADNTIADPDIAGATLSWGLGSTTASDIDIQRGEFIWIRYRVRVLDTILATQTLQNSIVPSWSSIDGVDADERTGTGGVNDYTAAAFTSTVNTADNNDLAKVVVSDTFAAGNVRVGDIITYRLILTLQEGTSDNLRIVDTLDAGLEFIATDSIGGVLAAPFTATAPLAYAPLNTGTQITTAGTAAAGQTITWDFGDLVNAGNNSSAPASDTDTLTIEYRVRVADAVLAQAATTALNNNADMLYDAATGPAPVEEASAVVNVDMPVLATTKVASPATTSTVNAGDTITYTVTVANSGNAPAYDTVISDTLSAGLRAGGLPTVTSITVNGGVVASIAPVATGTFASDGQIQWDFDNGSADVSPYTINAGQSLVLEYTVDVDAGAASSVALSNSAQVQNYYSFNDESTPTGSVATDRETFGPTTAAVTTHQTPTPNNLSKVADKTQATIGEIVTYTISVPNAAFGAQLFDVAVTDSLPSSVSFVSAAYAAGNGAGVTDALTTSVSGANVLTIDTAAGGFDIPANQVAVIEVQVRVNNTAGENLGDSFQNSASYIYQRSNGGADNVSGGVVVQAPAVTIEEPFISTFTKAGRNITKGDANFSSFSNPDAGDILEYELRFTADNAANRSDVLDLIIVDTLAAGTSYQAGTSIFAPGSSVVGVAAANVIGNPAVAGQVHTWNLASGSDIDIQAGETVRVRYRVQVSNTVVPGQVLSNSAATQWSGLDGVNGNERTGTGGINDYTLPAQTSTVSVRDNTAFAKSVNADSFGAGALASDGIVRIGDTIDFALTVGLNHGTTNNVIVSDSLPAGMEFVSTLSVSGDTTAPYTGSSPFTFNATAAPSVGQTNLTWNLGTVVNDIAITPLSVSDDLVIIYRVRIADGVLAAAATSNLQNNAALNYDTATGGAPPQLSNETAIVQQPILAMVKSTTAVSPVTAGQTISYTLRVENSGAAPAYDVQLQDVVPVGMRAGGVAGVTVTGVSINGGASVGTPAPAVNANFTNDGLLNWNLNAADTFAIPAGQALELSYTVVIDAAAGVGISLQNTALVTDYFSFDDNAVPSTSALPDRESFGPSAPDSTTLTTPPPGALSKTASPTAAAVGETVTYTLTVPGTAVNAALFDVDIADQLPSGVICAAADCNARFGPGNGASGAITATLNASNLLSISNVAGGLDIPANQQAVILVDVVVSDTVGAANQVGVAGSTFSNTATYTYETTNGGSNNYSGGPPAIAPVTVEEPNLVLTKQGPATIDLGGAPIGFTIWADNTGTSAAFNAVIQDQLPSQMRATAPASITVARFDTIAGVQQALLIPATDYTTSYSSATGDLIITLLNTAAAVVADNEVLRVQYNAQLDSVTGAELAALSGSSIVNVAAATQWNSVPSTNTDRRSYSNTFNTGTDADADDFQAAHSVTVNAPVLSLVKSVQNITNVLSSPNADPGDTLSYSIAISNTGNTAATVDFTDDIEALNPVSVFVPNTLTNITVAPAAVPSAPTANNSNATGGLQGTGVVAFTGIEVPAGATRTISFEITLRNTLPNGSLAYNQASVTAPFLTAPVLSDSNLAADNDANDQGNGPSLTDDDPVITRIPSQPGLIVEKRDTDINGGSLELGDVLRYTITVVNSGNENADNSSLTDAVPGNTTYVANSTRLNGVAVADSPSGSPLATGISINSADTAVLGRISGNQLGVATIEFDVTINAGLVPGTVISNQALVTSEGVGGPIPTSYSNDPDTDLPNDPTQVTVGNSPFIDVKKVVGSADSPLVVGSVLNYTFTVSNIGNLAATGVVLQDALPNDTSYVPNSTQMNGVAVADVGAAAVFTTPAGMPVNNLGSPASTLAASQSAEITFQVTVDAGTASGTIISNQGVVSSNELPDEESDVDGNDENGDQPTEILFGNGPVVRINKQVLDLNGGTVEVGDTIEYLIQVRNIGNADATSVVVTDDISTLSISHLTNSNSIEGLTFTDAVDADDGDFTAGILTANIGTLTPLASSTVRFRATVDAGAAGTEINNQARAVDASGGDVTDNAIIMIGGTPGSANLSGQIWLDLDHDDIFDVGVEPPQQGWIARIYNGGTLVAETLTDASGNYAFNGLPPGSGYEVQFFFGTSSASLGETITNGVGTARGFQPIGQSIGNIELFPGDNVIDQNLPIDPSGIVYDSITRAPVAGVTLNMYYIIGGTRTLLPASCLNPGQAGQVTTATGFYAFDVSTAVTCPGNTATYEIEISAVPSLFINGVSTLIPPQAGPFDATPCQNGAGGDAVATTPDCEISAFNTQPTGVQPTTFYIEFDLDGGDPNVFNNHIPIDPILEGAIVLRKTTPKVNVSRGELVPYTITATISPTLSVAAISGLEIRDTLPPGFKYVAGSARVNGVAQAPSSQVGRNFVWNNLTATATQAIEISMVLIVGAGVTENRYVNTAQVFNTTASASVSNVATATVRVVPDPTFDCTDIIGKVFDDADANGYQDKGEEALPAVRVATARGLLVTTDNNGRYHITCAAVPNEERGSNFILKLDERTLPSGYRVTTENPRVVRATRGKVVKANFGATIHRVVRIDLMDAAFVDGSDEELREQWSGGLDELLTQLQAKPSILRLVYLAQDESKSLAEDRLENIKALLEERWEQLDCCYNLPIETNVYWRGYESRNTVNNNKVMVNGGAE